MRESNRSSLFSVDAETTQSKPKARGLPPDKGDAETTAAGGVSPSRRLLSLPARRNGH
jgi:hypothetical protein